MSKRAQPSRGKPFASALRFNRALELFNHEIAAEHVAKKLAAAPQPLDVRTKLSLLDELKLFPAAMGVGQVVFGGPPPGPGAFTDAEAASIHLWINDKLECAEFKKECRRLPGTFVANYGAKPWVCGLCNAPIPMANLGGWKPTAKYWTQPTGKKLCKECVVGRVRQKLGDDDAEIKRRFRAIFARKGHLLVKAGISGYVTFGYEREDSAEEDEDEAKAKKAKTEDGGASGKAGADQGAASSGVKQEDA